MDRVSEKFVLEAKNIKKSFSGVEVLHGVDFRLRVGEVHALLGENGAGKSTLMKILSGVYTKTAGEIYIDGKPVNFNNRHDAEKAGIGMIFQEFSQVKQLSVAENLYLNNYPKKQGLLKVIDWHTMNENATERFQNYNINISPRTRVSDLGVAKQQIVEIVKAMLSDTKILIMDEPTSSLTDSEIEVMFDFVREIKNRGISIVYISHRMDEIAKICDRATILRDGHIIETVDAKTPISEIITKMIGKELAELYPVKQKRAFGPLAVETENMSKLPKFKNISIKVHCGEIVGIAGLVGAGKTELCTAIYGLDKGFTGLCKINGETVTFRSAKDGRDKGIGLIPESRQQQGVIIKLSALENISLINLKQFKNKFCKISLSKERETSRRFFNEIDIRPKNPDKKVSLFSGGNQQKIVISKWLCSNANILIFDEPTRGIDVGARSEIYKTIQKLADEGSAIIVSSSDIQEILGISDSIYTLSKGKVSGYFKRDDVDLPTLHKAINN